jgi:Rrf2 family protein
MRTISKRTQYGLKAGIALGRRYGEGPVLIATLAAEETIPLKFLEGILLDLKGRGVLESKKGKGGGYQLSRPPSTITIGSIIRLLEGPLAPLPCASETAFKACEECQDIEHCGTRIIMRQVRDGIAAVLDKTTLADLIRQVETAKQEHSRQPLMYHI